MKILISGWYGFGNVGDEAILQAMVTHYASIYPRSEVRVLSFRPKRTLEWQGVKAANQPPNGLKSWIGCLLLFRWIKTIHYFLWCDKFVMGGGGFLSDWDRKVPALWLRQFKWAKTLGKATSLYGVGVGPIFGEKNRGLISKYLERYVDEICVRDEESRNCLVTDCGVSQSRVSIEIDPVAKLDCNQWKTAQSSSAEIAVVYAKYFDRKQLFGNSQSSKSELESCYSAQLNELKSHGYKIKLISFHPSDEKDWLDDLARSAGLVASYPNDFKRAIGEMSQCKGVISFRLHGNILAHALGIPYLPIVYHHKGFGFLDMAGKSRDCAIVVGDGINLERTEQDEKIWVDKTREFIKGIA